MNTTSSIDAWGLAFMSLFYCVAGLMHFIRPKIYLKIMPPYLPRPLLLVYLSGAAETGLGLLLLAPAFRALAAWGIIAMLIAIFPANIYMAQQPRRFKIPRWALLIRLPVQGLLILWAYLYT